MVVEFRAVRGGTGDLLRSLLTERGIQLATTGDTADAIISWGVRLPADETRPALNGNAGWDKFEELSRMKTGGVLVPPFSLDGGGLQFPILGRRRQHTKAKDIIAILQNDKEFEWRKAGGASDYFVQYIPKKAEFRVWSYRRRPLGVYEKVMQYPERYTRIGWNWQQGFAFNFVENPPEALRQVGAAAVASLGLDFGAVDIIQGMDDQFYALEVNTAPGVQSARAGITNLANRMAKWVALGCPKRREE